MHRIRVGVLRGGPSNEYDISLKTGATVLNNLSQDKYNSRDIFIDKEGQWHMHGLPIKPHDALTHLDVIFNGLHGHYGEDGKVQHILESHGIPFTGSGSFSSAIGMNRIYLKDFLIKNNLKTPRSKVIDTIKNIKDKVIEIFRAFPLPVIVKPVFSGSTEGINIVKSYDSLENAIIDAMRFSDTVIVEEYILGKPFSCVVIDNYRDQKHYALPVIGDLSFDRKKEIERLAINAHSALGLRHYSSSDFIVHPHTGIYILNTNTSPYLTNDSHLLQSLEMVGAPIPHFLDHIIELALSKK